MSSGLEIILRTTASFFLILFIARFIGRRTVAQLRFQDLITVMMLGTIAGNWAFNIKISGALIGLSMITLAFISLILVLIEMRSHKFCNWIEAKPVIVIENGEILEKPMYQHKFTKDLLEQQLRMDHIFDIKEVEKAVLEKSGRLSILKKNEYLPLTLSTFKEAMANTLPTELIVDGKVLMNVFESLGLTRQFLSEEAKRQGYQLEKIDYAVKGSDGRIHFFQ